MSQFMTNHGDAETPRSAKKPSGGSSAKQSEANPKPKKKQSEANPKPKKRRSIVRRKK